MKTLLTSFLLLLGTPLLPTPVLAQVVAIRAGAIIDPAHGTSAKDQIILVV